MVLVTVSMNVSLDGYVDHDRFAPQPDLFRHWIEALAEAEVGLYGRKIYQLMQYWDADDPAWDADHRRFAVVWRAQRKYVASHGRPALGAGAELIVGDAVDFLRRLKGEIAGEITVSGTILAASLGAAGLIDTYRLYYHPVVLGRGVPFFAGVPAPALEPSGYESFGAVQRLSYSVRH